MLSSFTHIQKDDSLVPLLPYAAGCFLASIFLTISGIAETHPQALALATYLIQFGWLLLQIQGAKLLQRFGTQGQCIALFNVWFVSMQLLDVHRRFLKTFTSVLSGESLGSVSSLVTVPLSGGMIDRLIGNTSADIGQEQGSAALTNVRAYYTTMICSVLPAACGLSPSSLVHGKAISSSAGSESSMPITTASGAGMREMEYLVLFELGAGFSVSMIMCLVWLAMTVRRGGNGSVGVRRLGARWQQINRRVKSLTNDWRML